MDNSIIKKTINETILRVISKHGITMDMITEDKHIVADLKADSLDIIEMMLSFEDEFDLSVDEEVLGDIRTIGDIYNFVINNYETQPEEVVSMSAQQ